MPFSIICLKHCFSLNLDEVGVGLMALLQFGGLNGYAYYMNSTLESAGNLGMGKDAS